MSLGHFTEASGMTSELDSITASIRAVSRLGPFFVDSDPPLPHPERARITSAIARPELRGRFRLPDEEGRMRGANLLNSGAIQEAVVAAPVLANLDLEIEENRGLELTLKLLSRSGADLLNHPAPLSDENPLLRAGFNPYVGMDLDQPVLSLADFVDDYFDSVRYLFAGSSQDLLADQLCQMNLAWLIALVFGWIEERPFWKELRQASGEGLEPSSGLSADREDLVDRVQLRGGR